LLATPQYTASVYHLLEAGLSKNCTTAAAVQEYIREGIAEDWPWRLRDQVSRNLTKKWAAVRQVGTQLASLLVWWLSVV